MNQQREQYSAVWEQFLIGKRSMLAQYDQAVAHSKEQVVATHHGVVAEAAIRDWLSSFLPKRFGVTSGFIRAQGFETPRQSAHFDVIIYEQLDAPILWVESNKDKSEGGRSRIVPAEYVRAILEVKSAFNRRTVNDAAGKLAELAPLIDGVDAPDERYPKYLPASAVLAMLFFELRKADQSDLEALNRLRDLHLARPLYGAVILRGEGRPPDDTALIQQTHSDAPHTETFPDQSLLYGMALSATSEVQGHHRGAMLRWSAINFSQFAFDLLALLKETYRSGYASSLHGLDFSRRARS
jgi:hypothetical protein